MAEEEKKEKEEKKLEEKARTYTTPIIMALLAVVAFLGGMYWTKMRTPGGEGERVAQVSPSPALVEEGAVLGELASTIGRFSVIEGEICQEDGKPIVYFFGSESCPHCTWEHPIFEKVTAEFEGLIYLHNNMDELETDREIFEKYSQINQGGIPFTVLGCRYARVGSGEGFGEEKEEGYLTALICKLTDGKPAEVCEGVADLIEQIED